MMSGVILLVLLCKIIYKTKYVFIHTNHYSVVGYMMIYPLDSK